MRLQRILNTTFLTLLLAAFVSLAGCTAASAPESEAHDAVAPDAGVEEHGEHEHDGEDGHDTAVRQFIPNGGAVVRITSPANDTTFAPGANVPVAIETVNFSIGEDGNHWHIYVDGDPIMVMGGNTFVLQNLSPGHHEIEVFLSLGTHEDLEQGDSVMIRVAE